MFSHIKAQTRNYVSGPRGVATHAGVTPRREAERWRKPPVCKHELYEACIGSTHSELTLMA
ncbi:hypothetical protein E2C01_013894 [Portunus trituberculatus]|uniref:Uncharacterized protein n=1 Tax=Portunus trituberculatus TaxID=210409 RepID=A0A5B7DHF2_PORTR|nr:hypothetical protein [Portunus trituberculatus]